MRDLNITISGEAGTGRTTICQLISETLQSHGFDNIEISGEDDNSSNIQKTQTKRLKNMRKDDMIISIKTIQICRAIIKNKE